MVIDVVMPRVLSSPDSPESLGAKAVEFARRNGLTLDPEQELVLEKSLGVRADDRWQSFEVGLNVPRQNGKGEVLMARELFGLFELGERFIVHSAHEFKTSEKHFQRLEGTIRRSPELFARIKRSDSGRVIGFRYSHGDEAIELQSGERIEFRTRTKGGMRGFEDVALLVMDEAMIISEAAMAAMMPTLRASKATRGPQLWYAGSAVDQLIHDQGLVWARIRERGLRGDDPALTYAEWSLDYEVPADVPDEVLADPECWRQVNFAIERGRVLEEHMEREFRSLPARSFAVELLGVGDWPATDADGSGPISMERWDALADQRSEITGQLVFAFDVTPERRSTSVCAVGERADGLPHVEMVEQRAGTGWVVDYLIDRVARHEPVAVVCDELSPAASLVPELAEHGIDVQKLNSREHANACGMLFDAVEQERLRHIGQKELRDAVKGATTRPLLDAWAWSRKGGVNISPLVACTLALWAHETMSGEEAWAAAW